MAKEILGTSRLSHKFQVTIPLEVKERFKLGAKDIIVFVDDSGKLILRKNLEV